MKLRRSPLLSCSSSLALVCLAYTSAEAQQFNWTGNTSTDWTTGSNWQGGAAPSSNATSTAQIRATSGTSNILTYTAAQGNSTFTGSVGGAGRGLVIGSVSSGSMSITGGTFSTVGQLRRMWWATLAPLERFPSTAALTSRATRD